VTLAPLPAGLPYWRLSGYYFFYFAFIGVFSPFFGLYLQALQFSAWDIGLLMSQMQLMRLAGPYVWGWWADRRQQRAPIVRLAAVLSLAGFTLFFFFREMAGMFVAMALLAFFWSAALPLVETLTFDHLASRPERYSKIRLWGSIGFICAVLGAGWALDSVPVEAVLWLCWLLLLGILLLALLLPEATAAHAHPASPPVREILARPHVRALFAACFAMSAAHGALYVFLSIHLSGLGYAHTTVGLLWSLGVLAEIGLFMIMGRLTRRFSLRVLLLASFAAAVLRFVLIGWWADVLLVILLAQLLHGLTFGVYHVSAVAAVNRWFPGRCQARGQALYSSISFGAGGLLGGLLAGWAWESWGAGWTYSLSALFALLGLVLIALWVRPQENPANGG
jgi:PPP family 3-phenylpropionic acid transporter